MTNGAGADHRYRQIKIWPPPPSGTGPHRAAPRLAAQPPHVTHAATRLVTRTTLLDDSNLVTDHTAKFISAINNRK